MTIHDNALRWMSLICVSLVKRPKYLKQHKRKQHLRSYAGKVYEQIVPMVPLYTHEVRTCVSTCRARNALAKKRFRNASSGSEFGRLLWNDFGMMMKSSSVK